MSRRSEKIARCVILFLKTSSGGKKRVSTSWSKLPSLFIFVPASSFCVDFVIVALAAISWTCFFGEFKRAIVKSRSSGAISRSTSSSTTASRFSSFNFFRLKSSRSLAGVPIITAGFSFKFSTCLFIGAPPIKSAVFISLIFLICVLIWLASSKVGATTISFMFFCGFSSDSIFVKRGRT